MKFVVALLACVVAAQASFSSWPSTGYSSRCIYVYPKQSDYCLNLPFDQAWCTAQYYADILKSFPQAPGTAPKQCEEEHKTPADEAALIDGYRKQLEDKLNAMEKTLTDGLKAFQAVIKQVNDRFLSNFKAALAAQGLAPGDASYDAQVKAYEAQLKALKAAAEARYTARVAEIKAKIAAFHAQLLTNFQACLTSRKAKLVTYNLQIDARAKDIISKYDNLLTTYMTKKKNFVVQIFTALYSNTANQIKDQKKFDEAMKKFDDALAEEKKKLTKAFEKLVNDAKEKMKESYRCNYKCYFSSGCYGFNRRSFSRSCVRFPCAPRYTFKMVSVCAFNPTWKGCPAPPKKTPANTDPDKFDDKPYNTDIDKKAKKYLGALSAQKIIWEKQVTDWKSSTAELLKNQIATMTPKVPCGQTPTQDQIDTYRKALQAAATAWLDAQELVLKAQVTSREAYYKAQITQWQTKMKAWIQQIKAQYATCMANKAAKVKAYETCLEQKIAARKIQLQNRLNAMANQHKAQFNKFYTCAFGTSPDPKIKDLKTAYEKCVQGKIDAIMAQFKKFWETEKGKYVELYKCGFKCSRTITIRDMCTNFTWNFCAPLTSSFFQSYC